MKYASKTQIYLFFRKALLLLRKKKYTEKILDKTDNELLNIENLIMDIEFKKVEENVLKGIQIGNKTLKQLNAVFSIEKIESILEESEEGIRKQQVMLPFNWMFILLMILIQFSGNNRSHFWLQRRGEWRGT